MNAAVLIPFLTELLTAVPELLADVEKMIADLKNPAPGPLAPSVTADTQALDNALEAPAKK